MTPLTKDINATDFVRDLNDALRYLEVGLVGGGASSLRRLSVIQNAQQFVTDLNYNLSYLDSNIASSDSGTLIPLTDYANAAQFVRDINIDLDYLESCIGGGSETSDTVLMQLQGGKIATATSSATTIDGNNVVGYPCVSINDPEFFNNCHTRLMLDIGVCTMTGVTLESGESLTIFCYNSSGGYIQHVSSVGSIPSGTRYVKFMVSKSTAYTSLRKLSVSVKGNATQVKNVTPAPVETSYFSFDTEYPSMDASDNIIFTGANNQSRYYDNGLIKLPPNYSTTGDAVPLVVYVHGTNGFDFYKGQKDLYEAQQNFVVNNGYAFCDCSGVTNVGKGTQMAGYDDVFFAPSFVTSIIKLVEHVTTNYNVKDDGVYLLSKSSGGYTLHLLTQMNVLTIKAAASLAPGISAIANIEYYTRSEWRATQKVYDQLNISGIIQDVNPWYNSSSSGYTANGANNRDIIIENSSKLRQVDPLFFGANLTDDEVRSITAKQFTHTSSNGKRTIANYSDCMNGFTDNGVAIPGLNSVGISFTVPTKIWIAGDDTSVSFDMAKLYYDMAARAYSPCEFREMASQHGGHHSVDTASNAETVSIQPRYSDEPVTIAVAYKEVVEFFDVY